MNLCKMCVVLHGPQGRSANTSWQGGAQKPPPVASPRPNGASRSRSPIRPPGSLGKGRISAIEETSLSPPVPPCGSFPIDPAYKRMLRQSRGGVPDALDPSRLQRGKGAFLLPLTLDDVIETRASAAHGPQPLPMGQPFAVTGGIAHLLGPI